MNSGVSSLASQSRLGPSAGRNGFGAGAAAILQLLRRLLL